MAITVTREPVSFGRSTIGMARALGSASLLAATPATSIMAQTPIVVDAHSHAIALSVDAGSYPHQFTEPRSNPACRSKFGVGAGISAIDRPRPGVFFEAELRGTMSAQLPSACDVVLIYTPASGVYSPTGFRPVAGTPVMPLLRTLVHGGFETPREISPVVVRGTAGVGMIWNAHPAPVAALTLGVSSRRPGTRIYAELERDVTRVRETEALFRPDSMGTLVPVGTAGQVAHPVWTTLRIGIEMPLR
jgi:hypothetical protein